MGIAIEIYCDSDNVSPECHSRMGTQAPPLRIHAENVAKLKDKGKGLAAEAVDRGWYRGVDGVFVCPKCRALNWGRRAPRLRN